MLHKFFRLAVATVAAVAVLSCKKECPSPPACYAGIVVARTCTEGVLIDVDPTYAIGAPAVIAQSGGGNKRVGNNVISVVNTADLRQVTGVGQRLYFTYKNDPNRQHYSPGPAMCCFANDGSKTPIPHLVLSNLSMTGCDSVRTN